MNQLIQLRDDLRLNRGPAGPAASATSWAINAASNKVIVGLEQPVTPDLIAQAQASYGDAVELRQVPHATPAVGTGDLTGKSLSIVSTPQAKVPSAQTQSRAAAATTPTRLFDDRSAYSSGNRLTFISADGKSYSFCTSAWNYVSLKHVYTAGHCFETGSKLYQGSVTCGTSTCTLSQSGVMGTVYSRQWGNGRTDWEGVDATGQGTLAQTSFIGSGGASTSRTSQGTMYKAAFLGDTVCSDGSVTGWACGKVVATEGCALISSVQVCGLESVKALTAGSRIVNHGDSGGPVRSPSNSGGYGVISAGNIATGEPGDFMWFATWRAICAVSRECSPQ